MLIRKPEYFDRFCCLAAACPDSCCKEWEVQVDPEAAAAYRGLPGPLGDRLRRALYEQDGEHYLAGETGRCPMWRADGLCRIQAELGEQALCRTCREFPRLTHDYGDFVELGLELSCPEAARLILSASAAPLSQQVRPGAGEAAYDREAMAVLLATREQARRLLSGEDRPVGQILALVLLYGCQAQEALDGGALPDFDPASALETAAELAQPGDMGRILELLRGLEQLTARWGARLDAPDPAPWGREHLALARYFVDRYWLQAVSDYDLYSRVKLLVLSCLVVRHLGGDAVRTAQLYSKEIENSADNVDALLDAAYESPALTDAKLLGLLLEIHP
ncbi:MAG: flagellin lysine-N-methylase [Eubacteriales bacterium]|nr:flagellin lysine-N-methylase [Eubacteriales bacterium]